MFLSLSIIVLLAGMVYCDFKYRQIPVLIYLLIGVALTASCLMMQYYYIINVVINLLVVILLMALVHLWFIIKYKKCKSIIDNHLGKGDVLFWLLISLYFAPLVFIWFQVFTMIIALLIYGIIKMFSLKERKLTIPLAGVQALFVAAIEVSKVIGFNSIQFRDDIILNMLY